MKKLSKLAILAAAFMLAIGCLTACGEKSPEFEGTWTLDSIEAEHDGVAMTAEEVDIFERALGSSVTLTLTSTGTVELDNFGEIMTGSWEQSGEGQATLTITNHGAAVNSEAENGQVQPDDEKIDGVSMTIEGQTLTIDLGSEKLLFTAAAQG